MADALVTRERWRERERRGAILLARSRQAAIFVGQCFIKRRWLMAACRERISFAVAGFWAISIRPLR